MERTVGIKSVPLDAKSLARAIARVHPEALTESFVWLWLGRRYAHVMKGAFDLVDLHASMISMTKSLTTTNLYSQLLKNPDYLKTTAERLSI